MSKDTTAKAQAKATAQTAKEGAENTGLAAPSLSQVEKARAEGVTEAIKEQAKDAYVYATDGQQPGEQPDGPNYTFSDAHTNMIEGMLALGPDELADAIDEKGPMTEEQVANLMKLERNGPNRTEQVKVLCKRLGVKSPLDIPGAGGPGYTNDTSPISKL